VKEVRDMAFPSTGLTAGPTLIVVAVLVLLVGALIAFLTIARAGRLDPDPTGARPMAAFLFSGAFATLWVAIIGVVSITSGILGFFGRNRSAYSGFDSSFGGPKHPVGDANVRTITQGVLLVLIAGIASLIHRRRGLALAQAEDDLNAPSKKVARTYVGVVSFFSIAILIVAILLGLYLVFELIAPGIFGGGSRWSTVKSLIEVAVVVLVVGSTFLNHQAIAPRSLRLFSGVEPLVAEAHDHEAHDHDHPHEVTETN
jgi:hypothetical protein